MQGMQHAFDGVEVPRRSNATRHDLHELLVIALLSTILGAKQCTDMTLFGRIKEPFFRQFTKIEHGIPSLDAFSDLFNIIDPAGLDAAHLCPAGNWAQQLQLGEEVVASDGKSLRRSFADAAERSPLHLVRTFAAKAEMVLGQVRVSGKSNDITAMRALLELLDRDGATMSSQRATAERVTADGGDYVLALKGNRGTLHDAVRLCKEDPQAVENIDCAEDVVDKGHGRIEVWRARACHDVASGGP